MVRKKESLPDPNPNSTQPPDLRTKIVTTIVSELGKGNLYFVKEYVQDIATLRNISEESKVQDLNFAILDITGEFTKYWLKKHPVSKKPGIQTNGRSDPELVLAQKLYSVVRQPALQALGALYLSKPLTDTSYEEVQGHLENLILLEQALNLGDGKILRNSFFLTYTRALSLPPEESLGFMETALKKYQRANPGSYPPQSKDSELELLSPFIDFFNNEAVGEIGAAYNHILLGNYQDADFLLTKAKKGLRTSNKYLKRSPNHSSFEYTSRQATNIANNILLNLAQIHLQLASKGHIDPPLPASILRNFNRAKRLLKLTKDDTGYSEELGRLREYIFPALTTRFLHTLYLLSYSPQPYMKIITIAKMLIISGDTIEGLIFSTGTMAGSYQDAENVAELKRLSYIIKHLSHLASPPTSSRVDLD